MHTRLIPALALTADEIQAWTTIRRPPRCSRGNSDSSSNGATSADGRYLAFGPFASNLASGDPNRNEDVFVHDDQTGQTTRVSADSARQWSTELSGKLSARAHPLGSHAHGLRDPSGATYCYLQGTSVASPRVAGAAALVESQFGRMAPGKVQARITETADPLVCPADLSLLRSRTIHTAASAWRHSPLGRGGKPVTNLHLCTLEKAQRQFEDAVSLTSAHREVEGAEM